MAKEKFNIALLDIIWTTKDGTKIRLGDMETSHLDNCAKMLKRQAESNEYNAMSAWSYSGGDMAEYYASQEGDGLMDKALRQRRFISLIQQVIQYKKSIK